MEDINKSAELESGSTQQQPGMQNPSTASENKSTCVTSVDPSGNQFSHPKVDDEEILEARRKEPTEEEMDEKQNNARDAMNDDSYVLPGDEEDDGKLD